jgi:hypothetical protein
VLGLNIAQCGFTIILVLVVRYYEKGDLPLERYATAVECVVFAYLIIWAFVGGRIDCNDYAGVGVLRLSIFREWINAADLTTDGNLAYSDRPT